MAPVYGKPFLSYVLDRLIEAGIKRIVLATGYKHEVISCWFKDCYRNAEIVYSREETPLFTGGAIRQAATLLHSENFVVLNGDTLFDIDFRKFYDFHISHDACLSVALRTIEDTNRYGSVSCENAHIVAFREKADSQGPGDINGGIYAINRKWLLRQDLPTAFSFEKELMQPLAGQAGFYGLSFSGYFIDIGVPDDYWRAQREFAGLFSPDEFLFLDRDGVLNKQIVGDYVRTWSQWEWLSGVLPTLAKLSAIYRRIFLASNQQGIGKGLMSNDDLTTIHSRMLADISRVGARIDGIYTCTDIAAAKSPNRKPEIGLAKQAQRDFPEVDFHRAIMVGDNVTDLQFAQNAQMRAVYLTKNNPVPDAVKDITDLIAADLPDAYHKMNHSDLDTSDLSEALRVLRSGGIILYPTDTIWGIGCDATNATAVTRIFELKHRADSKAMLVLLDSASKLNSYVDVPETAESLLAATEEGKPITIIYPNARGVAESLIAEDGSIGIRITHESFSNALCRGLGKPLVSTSANISGELAAPTFDKISQIIKDGVDYICRYRRDDTVPKQPSAIIKINTDNTFNIIRA